MINFKLSSANQDLTSNLKTFNFQLVLAGYLNNICISVYEDHRQSGVELDQSHILHAILESPQYDRECKDVILFLLECEKSIPTFVPEDSITEMDIGHYLWHTRNYEGVGFWSQYEECGGLLTILCHKLLTTSEICLGIKEEQEEPRQGSSIYTIDFIH